MVKGLQVEWGTCFRTVLLDIPHSTACWNNLIATGVHGGNIITLDATTGGRISVLSGHTEHVLALAFSSDGGSLVSGGYDKTVYLWDIQTGGIIRVFYGHTQCVGCVSISQDQTTIASGSTDKTVRLWNAQTGECHCIMDGHNGLTYSVAFSPTNSQLLISASGDGTVQQWDINGCKIGPTYEGSHVAFSSDGTHFVSWEIGAIMIQKSDSGVTITKLHAPDVDHCCFSPDARFIAGACKRLIYIWDITGSDPCLIKTLVGHTMPVYSTIFSPSFIMSSCYRSIKLWKIDTSSTNPVSTDSESRLPPSSIMFISVQAKDHIVISSDEAGTVRTWDLSTGLCKTSIRTSAGPHSRRDIQLIDGRLLIIWCTRKKIHIWDTQKEKHPRKVDAISDFSTTSVRISGDGSRVFLLDSEHIQALSTQTGEVVGKVSLQGELSDNPLTVDGLRVWDCFKYLPTQGWDFGIPGSTSNAPLASPHLDFIHGTTKWPARPSKIRDTITGKEIFQLPEMYKKLTKFQCDGQYLVAGYESGEVLILDFCQMIIQ